MKAFLPAVFLLFIFTGCGSVKLATLMQEGSVSPSDFRTEIPFEYRMGLVVIPVTIEGKAYDFLVDTGAPNVLSKELAAALGAKRVATQTTRDSQGGSSDLDFVRVDSLSIGGLTFLETGAAVADLRQSQELACLHIDGFIGSNLMRKAVWQFDYARQIITIVPTAAQLQLPENAANVSFKPVVTGTPHVTIRYNGTEDEHVTFDTGANDGFSTSAATFAAMRKTDPQLAVNYGFGRNTSGLYGTNGMDTTHYTVASVAIGSLSASDQLVDFRASQAKTMGTKFLKNYTVIIDWSTEKITFLPAVEEPSPLRSFGFSVNRSGEQLLVGYLYHGLDAETKGLQLGDRILQIGDLDVSMLTDETWCGILHDGLAPETAETLDLILLRNEQELTVTLQKTAIVPQ